ncbi:hypothetical protein GBAR_LOCUS4777, partial [Geodia barretti]
MTHLQDDSFVIQQTHTHTQNIIIYTDNFEQWIFSSFVIFWSKNHLFFSLFLGHKSCSSEQKVTQSVKNEVIFSNT